MSKKSGGLTILLILFILIASASYVLGSPTVFYGTPRVNGVTVITGTNISLLVNNVSRTSVLANASAAIVYQIECPDTDFPAGNASFMIENLIAVGWGYCDGGSKLLNINATDNTPPVNTSSISPTLLIYDNSGNVNLSGVGTCSDDGYGMNETGPYRLAYKAMGSSPDTNCNVGGYNITNLTWGTSNDISFAGVADNYYCIQLQCQDLAGNIGYYNSSNNVLYDPTAPTISLVNSSFNTSNTTLSITFNYTDNTSSSNNASCTLYVDGISVASNSTTLNWTNTVLTASSTQSDGTHTAYVNCTDLAGNIGKSSTTLTVMIDTVAPTVTISSPAADNWTSDNTPTITFKFIDSISPGASCTIDINGIAYGINTGVVNNTNTNVDVNASLAEATGYSLKVNCTDNVGGNLGSSTARTINVDNTAPTVIASSPADNNWTTDTTPSFTFTATDALSTSFNCVLDINGTNYGTNTSVLNNTATTITANTALAENTGYSWNVNCIDLAGKAASSTARTINIDATAPVVSLSSPANNNWSTDTTPDFVFTATDNINSTLSCVLDIGGTSYGTNGSVVNNTATTITASVLAEATGYSWKINCSDQLQTTAATARTINIDNTAPTVSLSSPATNNWTTDTTPSFTFTATDALSTSFNCVLDINGISYGTNSSVANNTATTITASALAEASGYSWKVNCTDLAGKAASSTARTINIDNTAPSVTINSPSANASTNDNTTAINLTFTDTLSSTASCTIDVNGTAYGTNSSVANNTATVISINGSGLADNTGYSLKVNCTDLAGKLGSSTAQSLTVDTTAPSITVINSSDVTSSSATLNVVTNENATCKYATNGTFNFSASGTVFSTTSSTAHTTSLSSLSASTAYNYSVKCNDTVGNIMSTANSTDFTTSAATTPHTGGGGGGGGYYPSSETSAQQSIVAGGSGSFDFTKLYVTEINVTVKNGTTGKFTVTNSTKPSGSPLAIASADGLVYNYFEITSTIPNSNIATATITFKVLKTWISSNNIDPDQVFLKKLVNNEWVELPTIRTGEDASYYYYETTVSSFSSYVIVGHNKKAAPTVTTPAPTHKACSNLKCQATAGAGTDECQADSDCAAATTPPAEKPAAAEEKPPVPEAKKAGPSTALQIVTVIIIFVAVALVILSGVKKKRGRLKPIQEFKG